MRIPILALLLSALSLTAIASEKTRTPRIVADPLGAYFHQYYAAEPINGSVMVVVADFNCDGLSDFAISDRAQVGKSGTSWIIYLRRPDGRFNEIGEVETKNNRFRIIREKKGLARLAVMQRGGPGDLGVIFYRVSQAGLIQLADERVRIAEAQTGKTRIEEIFGADYSELPATTYSLNELRSKFSK